MPGWSEERCQAFNPITLSIAKLSQAFPFISRDDPQFLNEMREELLQDLSSEIKVTNLLTFKSSFQSLCKEKEISFLLNQFDEIVKDGSEKETEGEQITTKQLLPIQIVSAHRVNVKKQEIERLEGLLSNDTLKNEEMMRDLEAQSVQLEEMMKNCQDKCVALGL